MVRLQLESGDAVASDNSDGGEQAAAKMTTNPKSQLSHNLAKIMRRLEMNGLQTQRWSRGDEQQLAAGRAEVENGLRI